MSGVQCFVCGKSYTYRDSEFWGMTEIKNTYRVSEHKICCESCGDVANSFVDYYGEKKEKDLKKLRDFLASGVLPQRQWQAQMNGGYYA